MPAARHSVSPRPTSGRTRPSAFADAIDHAPGATAVFGSNLGPAHIHAVARRNQYLEEASRSRQARLAKAERTSPFIAVRRTAGMVLVAVGVWLHGDMPRPKPGCPGCDIRLAS